MKKRLVILFVVAALLSGLFCGCGPVAANPSEPLPVVSPTPELTPSPEPTPEPTPELLNLKKRDELKAYLIERLDAGEREIVFKFTGNTRLVKPDSLAQMLGLFGVEITKDPADKTVYNLTAIETPGARMVRAYQIGDPAVLSSDEEKAAYDVLLQLVSDAKDSVVTADDPVKLELALIDAICDMTTPLSNEKWDFVEADLADRPELTAIGVLLNGEANSYGYADAFYAAGTIAGLQVDYMYVKQAGQGNTAIDPVLELVNTVLLDGQWYIVHCGETDKAREKFGLQYKFVNRGVEARTFWDWLDGSEKRPLSLVAYGTTMPDWENIPELTCVEELRDWIASCHEKDASQNAILIPFRYVGEESLSDLPLSYLAWAHSIYLRKNNNGSGIVNCLFVAKSSGMRIVDAYISSDDSSLSVDEKGALQSALKIVNDAKEKGLTGVSLEKYIHDQIALRSHKGQDFHGQVDAYGVHIHNSAVGVLTFKEGKCQGYTDAFYAVAKIAGLNVGKLVVDNGNHIVNTITFDGDNWYIVDLTFNDWDNKNYIGHVIFNVGLDRYNDFPVDSRWMWYPIAETSNPAYLVN